jgi:hypothetical protein
MSGSSRTGDRVFLSAVLGFTALFVFFVTAAVLEVPGINSTREVVASCLAGGLYLGCCQGWVTWRTPGGLMTRGRTMVAMLAPLLLLAVVIYMVENRSWVPGLPWLLAGGLGSLAGAWFSGRRNRPGA